MTVIVLPLFSVLLFFTVSSFFDTNIVTEEGFSRKRNEMVSKQIVSRGVKDRRVLEAMRTVPRHLFVPEDLQSESYGDYPLPIGEGQTISQPYIVALMTELLELAGDEKVLEIGTGSGYQAAVLSKLAKEVYTLEVLPGLAVSARDRLKRLGYLNVEVAIGDGWKGLPLVEPFDAIIVTAAADSIPGALKDQLADGGRLVIPIGPRGGVQELILVTRRNGVFQEKNVTSVRFVPLVKQGEHDN